MFILNKSKYKNKTNRCNYNNKYSIKEQKLRKSYQYFDKYHIT